MNVLAMNQVSVEDVPRENMPSPGYKCRSSMQLLKEMQLKAMSHDEKAAKGPSRRCVSFAESVTEHSYPAVEPACFIDVYWGLYEIAHLKAKHRKGAERYRDHKPKVVKAIHSLHQAPVIEHGQTTLVTYAQEVAMNVLARSKSRGLERFMTNDLCRLRVASTSRLLALQEQFRGQDPERVARVLHTWSVKSSLVPVLYALYMAKVDERAVDEDDSDVSEST